MKISKQNQDLILDIAKAIDNNKKTYTQFQLQEFAKKVGSKVTFMVELEDIIKTLEIEYNTILFLEKSHNVHYILVQHHKNLISDSELKFELDSIMSDFSENDKKLVNDIFANEKDYRLKLMLHSALQLIFFENEKDN